MENKINKLKNSIEEIKHRLMELGDIHQGSISTQYNVCGNPNCACKDSKNPKKHGPYNQLSFSYNGKSTTRFIKADELDKIKTQIKNYKTLKLLTNEWIGKSIELQKLFKKLNSRKE